MKAKSRFVLLELAKDKFLAVDLIIHKWKVISKIDTGDQPIQNPLKLPFFDYDKFPYLIVNETDGPFNLLNIKKGTIQLLI